MSEHRILLGTGTGDTYGVKREVKVFALPALTLGAGDWQTVDHEPITNPLRFTLTFDVVGPTGRLLAFGAMGLAGFDEVTATRRASSTTFAALRNLVDWHLNDLQAGCAHQTVVYESSPYGPRPSLQDTVPCPLTGYRYGSAWLVRPLTAEVIALAVSVGCVVPAGVTP